MTGATCTAAAFIGLSRIAAPAPTVHCRAELVKQYQSEPHPHHGDNSTSPLAVGLALPYLNCETNEDSDSYSVGDRVEIRHGSVSVSDALSMFVAQNAEIFTLTYGSIVRQLITDLEDINDVNKQLDAMCGSVLQGGTHQPSPLGSHG